MEPLNKEKRKKAMIKALVLTALPVLLTIMSMRSYGNIIGENTKEKDLKIESKSDSLNNYVNREEQLNKLYAVYNDVIDIADSTRFANKSKESIKVINKINFTDTLVENNFKGILLRDIDRKIDSLKPKPNPRENETWLDSMLTIHNKLIMASNENEFLTNKKSSLEQIGAIEFRDFEIGNVVKELVIASITRKEMFFEKEGVIKRLEERIADSGNSPSGGNESIISPDKLQRPLDIIINDALEKRGLPKKVRAKEENKLYNQLEALIEVCGKDCEDLKLQLNNLFNG